jgi:hypothetical protein
MYIKQREDISIKTLKRVLLRLEYNQSEDKHQEM